MKQLVIDDVRVMDFETEYARTSAEAISALRDGAPWDEVWWDHDLGGDDTVYPAVMWVMETAFFGSIPQLGTCIIHTDNPVGRDMLQKQLGRYYPIRHVDAASVLRAILPH